MTHADPDDAVMAQQEPQEETKRVGLGEKVSHPLAVILGLGVAAAAGVLMTEEGPPPVAVGTEAPQIVEEAAPTSVSKGGTVETAQLGFPPRPGGMPPIAPEIVVAFKDKSQIKPICDLYWKDKSAAREAFAEFAADRPYLKGLRLKSVNYSDNLILELADATAPPGSSELRALYGTATKLLRSAPEIKYAEPNSTAQPGKDRP